MIAAKRPLPCPHLAQRRIDFGDIGIGIRKDKAALVRRRRAVLLPLLDKPVKGLLLAPAPADPALPGKDRQRRQEFALVHQVEGAPLIGIGHPHDLVQFGGAMPSP